MVSGAWEAVVSGEWVALASLLEQVMNDPPCRPLRKHRIHFIDRLIGTYASRVKGLDDPMEGPLLGSALLAVGHGHALTHHMLNIFC